MILHLLQLQSSSVSLIIPTLSISISISSHIFLKIYTYSTIYFLIVYGSFAIHVPLLHIPTLLVPYENTSNSKTTHNTWHYSIYLLNSSVQILTTAPPSGKAQFSTALRRYCSMLILEATSRNLH